VVEVILELVAVNQLHEEDISQEGAHHDPVQVEVANNIGQPVNHSLA
jgi:hypothetical protein